MCGTNKLKEFSKGKYPLGNREEDGEARAACFLTLSLSPTNSCFLSPESGIFVLIWIPHGAQMEGLPHLYPICPFLSPCSLQRASQERHGTQCSFPIPTTPNNRTLPASLSFTLHSTLPYCSSWVLATTPSYLESDLMQPTGLSKPIIHFNPVCSQRQRLCYNPAA